MVDEKKTGWLLAINPTATLRQFFTLTKERWALPFNPKM
jgi:hypothetical protein